MTKKSLLLLLVCLAATACAGGRLKEQQALIERCQTESGKLRGELSETADKALACDTEKAELEGRLSDLGGKLKAADERASSLLKSNKDLSKSLEANKGELQGKVKELVAEKDELGRRLSEAQKEKIVAERSILTSQKKADAARGARDRSAAEVLELKAELERLSGERKEQSAASAAAAESAQGARSARLAKVREDMGRLADVMLKELQAEKATVSQDNDLISIMLLEPLLFEAQQAKLTEGGVALLDRLGGVLHSLPGRNLRVEAHSDNSPIKWELFGRFTSHWDLSSARATAVARYLHEHGGLDPRRLTASGFGEFRPLKPNDTPAGRESNRRVVLVLEPAAS